MYLMHKTNAYMLSLSTDGEWIVIKFEVETKFKMAAIAHFVGLRHKSLIQPLAIGVLGIIGCFVAIIGTATRVNSLCQTTERLLFFWDKHYGGI